MRAWRFRLEGTGRDPLVFVRRTRRYEGVRLAISGAALWGDVVADGALQHGVAGFERVEDRAHGDEAFDFECDFAGDLRERAEMRGENYLDHVSDFLHGLSWRRCDPIR